MAIQPIDLQTLLMRLGQVGKEEAAIRQAAAQSQSVTGSEIARRSAEQQRQVTEAETLPEDGAEQVHDDESGEGSTGGEKRGAEESEEEREDDQVFRDPDLGQNVDISG